MGNAQTSGCSQCRITNSLRNQSNDTAEGDHAQPTAMPNKKLIRRTKTRLQTAFRRTQMGNHTSDGENSTKSSSIFCGHGPNPPPQYTLASEEYEQDRRNNQHFLIKYCFGGNYSAPVRDLLTHTTSVGKHNILGGVLEGHSSGSTSASSKSGSFQEVTKNRVNQHTAVLDISCGTGIWVLEMASEFPEAHFYGIDVNAMYPTTIKPGNAFFIHGDVLDGLPYPDSFFDYVHIQLVYNCFTEKDHKRMMHEVRRVLKPGGYMEFRDIDPSIRNKGPICTEFQQAFQEAFMVTTGADIYWAPRVHEAMQHEADMADIHHQVVSINFISSDPLNDILYTYIKSAADTCKRFFMEEYNVTSEEYDEKITQIMDESKRYRSFINCYMCWGRKPLLNVHTRNDIAATKDSLSDTNLSVISESKAFDQSSISDNERDRENASDIYQFVHGYVE